MILEVFKLWLFTGAFFIYLMDSKLLILESVF